MAERQECRVHGVLCFRDVCEGRTEYFITRPNGKLRTVGESETEARRMIDQAIERGDIGPQANEALIRAAYERSYAGSNATALSWSAFLGGWRACERHGTQEVAPAQAESGETK